MTQGIQLSQDEFIIQCNIVHESKYDYSETIFNGNKRKILIICPIHGEFEQLAQAHIRGQGCPLCYKESRLNIPNFVEICNKVHNNYYSYSKTDLLNRDNNNKVIITCPIHGDIKINPRKHINGTGCGTCNRTKANKKRMITFNSFIARAKETHGDKYDYSKVDWNGKSRDDEIEIICPIHGSFDQKIKYHHKHGCSKCSIGNNSKMENEWLDQYNIPIEYRNYRITIKDKTFIVDGFEPETNTIYEFWGDYWHGNPKLYNSSQIHPHTKITFGELYQKTLDKINHIKKGDFNLVEIWEHDWISLTK